MRRGFAAGFLVAGSRIGVPFAFAHSTCPGKGGGWVSAQRVTSPPPLSRARERSEAERTQIRDPVNQDAAKPHRTNEARRTPYTIPPSSPDSACSSLPPAIRFCNSSILIALLV